jgi:hypothetical protein
VFERLTASERIDLAQTTIGRVLDHFLYLLELHANNLFVVYSPTLVSQIPPLSRQTPSMCFSGVCIRSKLFAYARSGIKLTLTRRASTVVKLIDTEEIIEMLADAVSSGVKSPFARRSSTRNAANKRSETAFVKSL